MDAQLEDINLDIGAQKIARFMMFKTLQDFEFFLPAEASDTLREFHPGLFDDLPHEVRSDDLSGL